MTRPADASCTGIHRTSCTRSASSFRSAQEPTTKGTLMTTTTSPVRHAIARPTGETTWTRKDGDIWRSTCLNHGDETGRDLRSGSRRSRP
jgi:hypothetical protein